MSFFGFDTNLPRGQGHSSNAPGFGQARDPFAAFGKSAGLDDDAIDFEDTYDGLGNQLDETDDVLNDDTFGADPATQQSVGRDFDFAGQTSKIADTIHEEQRLFEARTQRPQPPASNVSNVSRPARSGYESYQDPNYIPRLEFQSDIWGIQPKHSAPAQQPEREAPAQSKRMMSLEEVEAMMRARPGGQPAMAPPAQNTPRQAPQVPMQQHQSPMHMQHQQYMPQHHMGMPYDAGQQQAQDYQMQLMLLEQQNRKRTLMARQQAEMGPTHAPPAFPSESGQWPQVAQSTHQNPSQPPYGARPPQAHAELPAHPVITQAPQQPAPPAHTQPPQQPTILPRQRLTPNPTAQQQRRASPQPTGQRAPSQPRQILQNPNRLAGPGQPIAQPGPGPRGHDRGPSFNGMPITHPDQLANLTDEQRAAFLEEDAKRAKRNHKIAQLAKDNGLMTPQDKNFITRIQLQQLMTATGNTEDAGPEAALAEDFYYQVFSSIRGAPRQTPNQPANQFAQTYLFQTNSRFGSGRRNGRGGDNHMQRMEQQVQRAVEAAKAKPKGKQLVVEGSLGKIAFSNSKTPRPLLNIKRQDTDKNVKLHKPSVADRKEILRNIEVLYTTMMRMEDHERAVPAPVTEDSDPELIRKHMEWQSKIEALHAKLWQDSKMMVLIQRSSSIPHPFIAMLSHAKGKKAVPRLFRQIDQTERLTLVTMIIVHLDNLPVVSQGIATPDHPLSPAMREEIELFAHSVMPPLFHHISESPLNIIIGFLGLILEKTNLYIVARSKIGMDLLTILVSRAELLKEIASDNESDWEQWSGLYNQLFDTVEPVLPFLFPGTANDTDDVYVWQYLAAMGVGASPDQQQRLVLGVKDRVMETVAVSKTLPADLAGARLANVNLFMRAIGLDVELLG